MTTTEAYEALAEQLRRIAALDQVAMLLGWDQETQMPPKGAWQRAEQCAAVAGAAHALWTDARFAEWLAAIDSRHLTPAQAVNVAEATRFHARATRIPPTLAAELARASAAAQAVWEAARTANAFGEFAPSLAHLVTLKRAEAACLAEAGRTGYDALLDVHEPGMTEAELARIFGRLRPRLAGLRERIAGSGRLPPRLSGAFPMAGQLALSRRLGEVFGYDWQAGRLDLAVHPSSSGTGGDVRITTRVNEADPRECLYSTIHELGHAAYEQGLDEAHALLPVGMATSMGVHESQSRLYENQIGRGRAFCHWLHPALVASVGDIGVGSPEALYAAVNAVETGFIRTEADEVHYNLHIMMRFDLERALVADTLQVADLEDAWNERFFRDFGRRVPDARNGVLQDVHWSAGLFGYFPTYTLGNIYAAELYAALRVAVPDLDARLAAGDLAAVLAWLRQHIHRRGRLLAPRALIAEACGRESSEAALLDQLEGKYGELYGL